MLDFIKDLDNSVVVNDVAYKCVQEAQTELNKINYTGPVTIKIAKSTAVNGAAAIVTQETAETVYQIKVRAYMTKPATSTFDFHTKWNNGVPMPYRVMVGTKVQETPGMVKMALHAEITNDITTTCMRCGRPLNNKISQYFGIGPECGGHNYVSPFETEEELKSAVAAQQAELANITWTGWIVKSAIENQIVVK